MHSAFALAGLERMTLIEDLLAHYSRLVAQMQDDLKSFESGRWRMDEIRDGRQVYITDEWIQELRHRVANLQQIIIAYERRRTTRSS